MQFKSLITTTTILTITCFFSGCVRSNARLNCDRSYHICSDMHEYSQQLPATPNPRTLDEMVEIALAHNLALKVKQWECAIQREVATGAKLDMLPELLATADASRRNNNPGSSSESLDPNVPPAPPSVSQEQHSAQWNFTLTWNLLDFGISYFRARQEVNRILIQRFEYEKMRQNLILEVVNAFWNAVVAKEAIERTNALLEKIQRQHFRLEKAVNSSLVSQTRLLEIQDNILDKSLMLQQYHREYDFALSELSRLMGLPPSSPIGLAYDKTRPLTVNLPDVRELETTALYHRPELYTQDIQERIDIDEVRVVILQYIPGISLFASNQYNDNKFLVNQYWTNIGARAIWDLLAVPTGRMNQKVTEKQIILTKKNRIALSIGAITQVNLAHLLYHDERKGYQLALERVSVKEKLLKDAQRKQAVGRFDMADVLEFENDALETEILAWRAYAEMQNSLEQLNNAIGLPLYYRNTSPTTQRPHEI